MFVLWLDNWYLVRPIVTATRNPCIHRTDTLFRCFKSQTLQESNYPGRFVYDYFFLRELPLYLQPSRE
jgi:hypothetical protein